jgi:hypothetical protein
MTNINLIRKTIPNNEHNINVVCDQFGNNTVAFLADIPKNALVTGVLVDGLHIKSAKNIADEVTVDYYRDDVYEGKRVVAVLHSAYDGNEIIDATRNLAINGFVVEYVETAIAEV